MSPASTPSVSLRWRADIRAHPTRFFVTPDHEYEEIERVVERNGHFLVVEKPVVPRRERSGENCRIADLIDLHHRGAERVIGCYLVETDDGLALFDCGPTSCIPALERGLQERGVELADRRHLLLSHIHLDHAGAAGNSSAAP